jgi:uncharacterized protein
MSDAHALYRCMVTHSRVRPFRHHFRYGVFSVLLDLDRLDEGPLAHNRLSWLSFLDRDHGDGNGHPGDWVRGQLAAAGYDPQGRIRLLCFPRLWGFAFNPLAIYFCEDRTGRLQAILHQVSNTFGERHSYLLPVTGDGAIQQGCAKAFHVSPFFPIEGGYRFRMGVPGDSLSILIRYQDAGGQDQMIAAQTGTRRPFTRWELAKAVCAYPLMTLKVVAGIHWEALKLWRKGATFHKKPPPPAQPVSLGAGPTNIEKAA